MFLMKLLFKTKKLQDLKWILIKLFLQIQENCLKFYSVTVGTCLRYKQFSRQKNTAILIMLSRRKEELKNHFDFQASFSVIYVTIFTLGKDTIWIEKILVNLSP